MRSRNAKGVAGGSLGAGHHARAELLEAAGAAGRKLSLAVRLGHNATLAVAGEVLLGQAILSGCRLAVKNLSLGSDVGNFGGHYILC